MKFDISWVAIVLAMVFFYLRLMMLRGKSRRLAREETLKRMRQRSAQKSSKKKSAGPAPEAAPKKDEEWFKIGSWPLAVVTLLFIFLGFAMKEGIIGFLDPYNYWWVVTAVAIVGLSFCLKSN